MRIVDPLHQAIGNIADPEVPDFSCPGPPTPEIPANPVPGPDIPPMGPEEPMPGPGPDIPPLSPSIPGMPPPVAFS